MITLNHFLWVGALLFSIGLFGALNRRNGIVVLMSIELMLNAVGLSFVAFGRFYDLEAGVLAAFFIMTVSAAEAGVGLALMVALFRNRKKQEFSF